MKISTLIVGAILLATSPAAAQSNPVSSQAPMARLAFMHGVWVGEGHGVNRDGTPYAVTQTERIGPMLGGDILVIEGRGYNADGTTGFNAFGVISWDSRANKYEFRSYAQGYSGTFPFEATDTGYVWETPAGRGVMRYTADVTATTFHEVGELVVEGQPPRRSFEMTLTRRSDTDWPAGDAITPTP